MASSPTNQLSRNSHGYCRAKRAGRDADASYSPSEYAHEPRLTIQAAIQRIYAQQQGQQRLLTQINAMLTDASPVPNGNRLVWAASFLVHEVESRRRNSQIHGSRPAQLARSRHKPSSCIDNRPFKFRAWKLPSILTPPLPSWNPHPSRPDSFVRLCSVVARVAEQRFTENQSLNTMVVFDEAQRFAAEAPEDEESKSLADRLS